VTITVSNQKPAVLDALHTIPCTGNYDPIAAVDSAVVQPILTPLNAAVPASIVDGSGNSLDAAAIQQLVLDCLGETVQPKSEQIVKELLGQTLVDFDPNTLLPVGETYAIQAGRQNKLPAPGPTVIYTATDDVIPAAKGMLAGKSQESLFFASLAYAFHPHTLGFWFQSSAAFDDFKTWLSQQTTLMSAGLPADTVKLLNDFSQMSLKTLTESLLLRRDDSDANQEHSFARLIIHMLMLYTEQARASAASNGTACETVGILPFAMGELFCPRSLVLVNVEAHARASGPKVTKEWKVINAALASPVKVVSTKSLSKLSSLPRAAAKAMAQAAKAAPGQPGSRSAQVKFRKRPPTKVDLLKDLTNALHRMGTVNRSQNIFRKSRTSFAKANRRSPDDFNKPGRITSVQYMPDIHVFVDCSGSISEENYQDAMLMLIGLAKKLNVNLYFSSFSHILSQEVLLKVENRSMSQIWREFRKVPKVNGGTDYKPVWDYINASNVHKRRLSLILTDFEYNPPSTREDHPKNLYYGPVSGMDWSRLSHWAEQFAKSMRHIDPSVKQKTLGMVI
jgi:hypothetical protein